MAKLSGYKKLVKWMRIGEDFKKVSTETRAESVIMDNEGTTLVEEMSELKEYSKSLREELEETKKSVSDGKKEVAAAITGKKVETAADATFAEMAENIGSIVLGSGTAQQEHVLSGKTFTNDDGVEYEGTMPNKGAITKTVNCGDSYTIPKGYHNGNGKVTAQSLDDALDTTLSKDFLSDLKSGGINSTEGGHKATLNGAQVHGDNSANTGCSNVVVYCKTAINFSNYNKLRIVVTLDNIFPGEAFTIWYSEGNTVGTGYSPLYALTTVADGTYDITLDVKGLTGNKYLVFNCNLGKTGADNTNGCSYTFKKIRLG